MKEIKEEDYKYIIPTYKKFTKVGTQQATVKGENDFQIPTLRAPNHYVNKLTSSNIRKQTNIEEPIIQTKLGLIIEDTEAKIFWTRIKKIDSIQLQSQLLSILHDDITTRDRLFRFKLINDPNCELCNEMESSKHKLFYCQAKKEAWKDLKFKFRIKQDILEYLPTCHKRELTVIARVLMIINYRVKINDSKTFINLVLNYLSSVSKKRRFRVLFSPYKVTKNFKKGEDLFRDRHTEH